MKCWSWIRQQPPTVIDTAARIQSLYYNCCLPQMTCWKSVTMKTYYSLIRCHNLAWHTQEKIHTTYTVWSLCLLSNLQLFYQRWKSNEGLQAVSPGLRFVSLLWPLIMPALGEPEGIGGGVMWHSALLATSPPPPTLPSCVPERWFKSVYLCFATASLQGWAWCITFGPGAMASLAVTRAAAWTSSSPPPPFFVFLSEVDHKKGKRKKTAAAFRAAKICWVFVIHIVISGFSIQHSHFAGLAGAINVLQTQQSQKYSISVQLCRPLIFLNMHF